MKEPERNWTRLIQFLLSATGGKAGAEDTVLDISCEDWRRQQTNIETRRNMDLADKIHLFLSN